MYGIIIKHYSKEVYATKWTISRSQLDQQETTVWCSCIAMCVVLLTFYIIVHNVAAVQVGQCLESAPENVLGVVHHQLQHGGVLPVLHQEVGEGTVAHLGQVAL